MLIALERLLRKVRQPASRARELTALRRRLRAERAETPDADEAALAHSVLDQKRAVAARLAHVTACSSCATHKPAPIGRFAGGACCSGVTADLFDAPELAALAHAGTRPSDLIAPRTDHAGCAFRGATGCTLELAHRPARCVHYICNTLRGELHARDELEALERELGELDRRMQQFRAAHRARLDREVLAPLVAALVSAGSAARRGAG